MYLSSSSPKVELGMRYVSSFAPLSLSSLRMLCPSEVDRCRVYRNETQRARFIAGRVLLREMLSTVFNMPLDFWNFRLERLGFWTLQNAFSRVSFSISYSDSLVLVAVSQDCTLGVDVERVGRISFDEMPSGFSRREKEYLFSLSKTRQHEALRIWTTKEAYAKFLRLGSELNFQTIEVYPGKNLPRSVVVRTETIDLGDETYIFTLVTQDFLPNRLPFPTESSCQNL